MQPDCYCPLCGASITRPIAAILPERGMVVANGRFTMLTGQEMALLKRLVEIFPRILSKEAALEWLYQLDTDEEPEIKIIDVYICKLRKKIEPLGLRIDTAWGKGYSMAAGSGVTIAKETLEAGDV